MAGKLGKGTVSRIGLESVESLGFNQGLKYKRMGEKRFWERWSTEKYGQYKAAMGMQIGGEMAQRGPDILKFIKQHDPQNSSGAIKDALDVMMKLQEAGTKPENLLASIQPLQSILGAGLYGAMTKAGKKTKKSEKIVIALEEELLVANVVANVVANTTSNTIVGVVEVPPAVAPDVIDIITQLIQAAEDTIPEQEADIVVDLLEGPDIKAIKRAYYRDAMYASVEPDMPVSFVDAINKLIPQFRASQKARKEEGIA